MARRGSPHPARRKPGDFADPGDSGHGLWPGPGERPGAVAVCGGGSATSWCGAIRSCAPPPPGAVAGRSNWCCPARKVFRTTGGRSLTEQRVTLAARRDGTLDALVHTGVTTTGINDGWVEQFTSRRGSCIKPAPTGSSRKSSSSTRWLPRTCARREKRRAASRWKARWTNWPPPWT